MTESGRIKLQLIEVVIHLLTEIRVGDKVDKLKEGQGLLQSFIVISRSWLDPVLKGCIWKFEFGVVPDFFCCYKASQLHYLSADNSNAQQVKAAGNETTQEYDDHGKK